MVVLLLKNKTTPKDPYHETFTRHALEPVFLPLLRHAATDVSATVEFLLSDEFLIHTPSFIITSQRAVEVFNECIDRIRAARPDAVASIFAKAGYTVGPATSKILREAGFTDVRGGASAGNGLVLSDIIINEANPTHRIAFFTGEIRKDIIPRKLADAGIPLYEKVIYRTSERDDIVANFNRVKPSLGPDSWIIFFSPQGTDVIVDYIVSSSLSFNIASIGPTTQQYLVARGITPRVTALRPEAQSLLECIKTSGTCLA